MPSKKSSLGLTVVLAMFATSTLFTATPAAAQTEKGLHTFGGKNANGFQPWAGLAFDGAGNLYGPTPSGHGPVDISGGGTVFKLTPAVGGGWVEQVVHSFEEN